MKLKNKLYFSLALLLVVTFLFSSIPVPVENIDGSNTPDKFVFGGFYWTSGLFQLSVGNYMGMFAYFGIFLISIGGIYLIK